MSDISDLPPGVDLENFALAVSSKPQNWFIYRTVHSLDEVQSPGYFDPISECLVRKNDRIDVIASADGDHPDFATLIVRATSSPRGRAGSVEVAKLERR